MEEKSELSPMNVLLGRMNRTDAIKIIWILAGVAVGFILLAVAVYPPENDYSVMKDTISFLGSSDTDNNPKGWFILSIALCVFSVLYFVFSNYKYRRMKFISKKMALLTLFLSYIACFGLILVGIFPDNQGDSIIDGIRAGQLHNNVSILAFGGIGFGMMLDSFIFQLDQMPKLRGKKVIKRNVSFLPYALFWGTVLLMAYFLIAWDIKCSENCWPGDGIYSFPLWEWIVFGMIFVEIIMITARLPEISSLEVK